MERIISFIIGIGIIVASNLLSNVVTDSVIVETSFLSVTNLGALTLAGAGAIIYAIPPVVFTSLGAWLLKVFGFIRPSGMTQSPSSPPPVVDNNDPPWDGKK